MQVPIFARFFLFIEASKSANHLGGGTLYNYRCWEDYFLRFAKGGKAYENTMNDPPFTHLFPTTPNHNKTDYINGSTLFYYCDYVRAPPVTCNYPWPDKVIQLSCLAHSSPLPTTIFVLFWSTTVRKNTLLLQRIHQITASQFYVSCALQALPRTYAPHLYSALVKLA